MPGAIRGLFNLLWKNKGKVALFGTAAAVDETVFHGEGRHTLINKLKQYAHDPSQIRQDFSGVVEAGHNVIDTGSNIYRGLRGDTSAWGDFLKPDENGDSLLGKLANIVLPMALGALVGGKLGLGIAGTLVMAGAITFMWKTFLEDKVKGLLGNVFDGAARHDPSAPSSAVQLNHSAPIHPTEEYVPGY
ncbi:MAG: hypothetical protein H6858_01650 [Rhodospirillales bacterium]|nr:hypothetical protein [Alphaproteobacteria bacterium]MCB1839347.1 hypothetical protein [Alphaproteobacteria bacterium]MCB9976287.1 hypothetical protein [Rhodospirillales bacterium]